MNADKQPDRTQGSQPPSHQRLSVSISGPALVFFPSSITIGWGFPPPAEPSSANVRFVLESKSALDAASILEKLKEKLKVANFQMSSSGNKATITLGFGGSFEDAIKVVDFGKVTTKDQATRTINIELP